MLNIRRKAKSLHSMLQVRKLQALIVTRHIIQVITAILHTVTTIPSVNRNSAEISAHCYADKTVFLFTSIFY